MRYLVSCPCGGVAEYTPAASKRPTVALATCQQCEQMVGITLYAGEYTGQFEVPEVWDREAQARIHLLACLMATPRQLSDPELQRVANRVHLRFYGWRLRRPWRWIPEGWQPRLFSALGFNQVPIAHVAGR